VALFGLHPKLRLAPLWPALAAVAVATALLWAMLPGVLARAASVQLADVLRILEPIVRQRLGDPGSEPRFWVREIAADSGLRLTLIAGDGRVIADSSVAPEAVATVENHRSRPEVAAALARGEGTAVRRSATTGHSYVYAARALSAPGGRNGGIVVLRLAEPLDELAVLRGRLATAMGAAMAAALLVILLTSLWLDRWLFRPLSQVIAGAGDLASGKASRVVVPEESELSPLAHALNRLAATAEEQYRAVRSQRDSLHEILATMSEGVLVVDHVGRAVLANPALRSLVDFAGDPEGLPVLEIVRHLGFAEIIDTTLRRGERQSRQIEMQSPERRTLLLETAPLPGDVRGAILVVRDTTEFTRVADMRRDFVANVSHELKTPLAAIRGYAETLRDGALDEPPTALRFTERILVQCQRLQALLDDLLTLSRLEGISAPIEKERVDLRAAARHAADLVAAAARERSVAVRVEDGGEVAVLADPESLERLLVNLLENGIKYNRSEGSVEVRVAGVQGEAILEVADSGIGIPPESIARIFERFYRVDKGRAREEGGTGLGLAIVKHIAQAHGGQVEVESRLGKGSTFRVRLPLAGR
jgi:two-component system phosphate regulon sensor histidine kinase PhoR